MSQRQNPFRCELANSCSGCSWHRKTYAEQQDLKIASVLSQLKEAGLPNLDIQPKFVSIDECGLRDRVDLVINNRSGQQKIGMYDLEHKEIIDLPMCPQLSPTLQNWLNEFRKIHWPIARGSVRLRVSPSGARGVWLDFANIDVKMLLDENSILENLLDMAFVEIGQRRKHLTKIDGKLKLIDPDLQPWFETFLAPDFTSTPLYCNVGGFTQPGFRSNYALVREVLTVAKDLKVKSVAEFGPGIGNFTIPLASQFERVEAFEIDQLACTALTKNLELANLSEKVAIHQGDFQNLNDRRTVDPSRFELVFVDPPRSGLKSFLDPFFASETKPKHFIYVSCYPESFAQDAKRLYQLGFSLKSLTIVDQFPQTPHAELAAHFSRT